MAMTSDYWGRVKKAHGLAVGREILGERWARDHADDKKPVLAAALEAAFDPAKSTACIGLGQIARDTAAAWLPPGMAYDVASDESDGGTQTEADAGDDDPAEIDPAALPPFLTDEEPATPESLAAE